MPLQSRNPILEALARLATDPPARRTVHAQLDDDLGVQSQGAGEVVLQAADRDMAYPAGFFCRQAADDEEISIRCAAGDIVVAFRIPAPSDVTGARVHEPVLWDPSGNRIRCNGSDGPEVTVGAGVCKVRSADADTDPVALAPATSSEIDAIWDWLELHTHTETGGETATPTQAVAACGSIASAALEAE